MIDVTTLPAGMCTTCGHGQRGGIYGPESCTYCGAKFIDGEHRHRMGLKVDGLSRCSGQEYLGCTHSEYDSQWGAGIFNDWPRGHHKPYGA